MIKINFNDKSIKYIKDEGWPLDFAGTWLFLLFALYEKKDHLLQLFDDKLTARRVLIMYRQLERLGYMSYVSSKFVLTEKGASFVTTVKNFYPEEFTTEDIIQEDFKSFITEYIALFPDGEDLPRPLKASVSVIAPRMEAFMKQYPVYSKETILAATSAYIDAQKNDFTYTRTAAYFIYKGRGIEKTCDLQVWCDRVINETPKQNLKFLEIL